MDESGFSNHNVYFSNLLRMARAISRISRSPRGIGLGAKAPSLDALASVNGEIIDRAFRACQQAAVCTFQLDDSGCECYFCTRWGDASKKNDFRRMCQTGPDRRQWEGAALAWLSNLSSQD